MKAITDNQRFSVGTKYKKVFREKGKIWEREYTIRDVLRTYNLKGELVNLRYVVSHDFFGQEVFDYDVVDTTIARALMF